MYKFSIGFLIAFTLTACANMNNQEQRMVSGAAIGGTLAGPIGAGIGAGFGYLASMSDVQPQHSTSLSNF
jgi:hypothetical protein